MKIESLLHSADIQATTEQITTLHQLLDLLLARNQHINLTAVRTYDVAVEKHILDSLLPLTLPGEQPPENAAVLDVGTGAGFPGLPLAVLRPGWHVTLLDSTAKKLAFINETAELLGITNITTVHARAEAAALGPMWASFDLVTARALAALPRLCSYTVPFAKKGGKIWFYKGPDVTAENAEAIKEGLPQKLGGGPLRLYPLDLPTAGRRVLAACNKEKCL